MSFKIAECFVDIQAHTSKLKSGLGQAKGMVKGFGGSLVGALGPVAALFAGAFGLAESIKTFAEGEAGIEKLREAVQVSGQDVESTTASFERFASGMMAITRVDDDASRALLTLATNMGLSGKQAEDTAQAAVGLQTAFGIDASTAVKLLTKEMNGQQSALQKSIPALKGVTDATERLKIISEAASNGFAQELAVSGTLSGQWDRLKNALDDLAESVGGLIAGGGSGGGLVGFLRSVVEQMTAGITVATDWKQSLIDTFTESTTSSETWGGAIVGWIKQIWQWMMDLGKAGIYSVSNLDQVWAVIGESASNAFNYIVARLQWLSGNFMNVGSWILENWRGIFTDVGQIVTTVFTNTIKNLKQVFSDLWANIKSISSGGGMTGFSALTDPLAGFESTISEGVKLLEFSAPKAADKAAKSFVDGMAEYLKPAAEEAGNKLADKVALNLKKTGFKFPDLMKDMDRQDKEDAGFEEWRKKNGFGDSKGGSFTSVEDVFKQVQGGSMENKLSKDQLAAARAMWAEQKETNKKLGAISTQFVLGFAV